MPSRIETEATQYKSRLQKALADGKVDSAEAKQIVNEAKAKGFTEVEALYLAGWAEHNSDRFDPAARKTLHAFVEGAMAKHAVVEAETGDAVSGEPGLTKDDAKSNVKFEKPSGSVSVGGIGADDPIQGQVGDCYFVSSLAAVANSHPELLQKNIKANGDGTYTVSLWQHDDMTSAPRKVNVTIDGSVPEKSGSPEYISSRSGKELWPLLYEKAYAQWKGSYENIQGGMGANALSALTGARPGFFPVLSDMNPDAVWTKLQAATAKGGCVVADSKPYGSDVKGIVSDHTYTVLGTEEKDGQKLVKLRNPWGEKEPGHDGTDDGTFTLPVADFVRAYQMVEYVHP